MIKRQLSQSSYLSYNKLTLNAHDIECLISSKFYFDCTEALFYKGKMDSRLIYVVKKETRKEGFTQI